MKIIKAFIGVLPLLVLAALNPQFTTGFAQGSLIPPGPPGPTMKSASQIEPRTPVDAVNTPGGATALFTITQPGSYYLTGNINAVTAKHGILIQTNDVTLDLHGFALVGVTNSLYGIVALGVGTENVVIRNGTLRNWGTGLGMVNGFGELEHLRVYECQNNGVILGDHCSIRNCTIMANCTAVNFGSVALQVGNMCVVTDCLVSSNSSLYALYGGSDCVVAGCQASGNDSGGMNLGNRCQIHDCIANDNLYVAIVVGTDCTVKACTADSNGYDGILVGQDSVVMENHACFNGDSGIESQGSGSRIENNQTLANGYIGILTDGGAGADVIVRNLAGANALGNISPTNGTTLMKVPSWKKSSSVPEGIQDCSAIGSTAWFNMAR